MSGRDYGEHAPNIVFDNILQEWRLKCSCGGFDAGASDYLGPLADAFDDHVDEMREGAST